MAAPRLQSQATAISLRLKYNYDPRLVIMIMIIIKISFYTPESDSLIYVGLYFKSSRNYMSLLSLPNNVLIAPSSKVDYFEGRL